MAATETLQTADYKGLKTVNDNGDGTGYVNTSVSGAVVPGTGATNLGKAEDAPAVSGDTGVMSLFVRNDTNAAQTSTDGDYGAPRIDQAGNVATKDAGPMWTSVRGIAGVPFTSADQHSAAANCTDLPTSTQKLVITDVFISVDTAMNVTFKIETAGTVIIGPIYIPANGTVQLTPRSRGWKLATADKHLQVITSVAGNISVDVHYYSEP
jgi:hypothetical protein